jgi:deoxycytidine triphosphate deaminase
VGEIFSFGNERTSKKLKINNGFVLNPEEGIVVETIENISLPTIFQVFGYIISRSSYAREGLAVSHDTIDPGHNGPIKFVLMNVNKFPRIIRRGERVAQMILRVANDNPAAWYSYRLPIQTCRQRATLNPLTLTLGNVFKVFEGPRVTNLKEIEVPQGEKFVLSPKQFVLGKTQEVHFEGEGFIGHLSPTDTYLYRGVQVLEGLLNPGYKGTITLEIKNWGSRSVELTPGVDICRVYHKQAYTFGSYEKSPWSKYVGPRAIGPQL